MAQHPNFAGFQRERNSRRRSVDRRHNVRMQVKAHQNWQAIARHGAVKGGFVMHIERCQKVFAFKRPSVYRKLQDARMGQPMRQLIAIV